MPKLRRIAIDMQREDVAYLARGRPLDRAGAFEPRARLEATGGGRHIAAGRGDIRSRA